VLDQRDTRRLQGRLQPLPTGLVKVAVPHGPDHGPAGEQAVAEQVRDLTLVGAEENQLAGPPAQVLWI